MSAEPIEQQVPTVEEPPAEPVVKPVKKAAAKKAASNAARGGGRVRRKTRTDEPTASQKGEESGEEATAPMEEAILGEEREEWFQSAGFRRMKTDWSGEDGRNLQRAKVAIDRRIWDMFPDALMVMNDLYTVVRLAEADPATGESKVDSIGFPVWQKDPRTGAYIEDWSLLTTKQREHFLFRIVTNLFDWELRSSDLWTEAMFSKAIFTERYAVEFDAPPTGTIDDRNSRANELASEERFFAIFSTAVSRKAEAIVRTMTTIQLRLKDSLGQ